MPLGVQQAPGLCGLGEGAVAVVQVQQVRTAAAVLRDRDVHDVVAVGRHQDVLVAVVVDVGVLHARRLVDVVALGHPVGPVDEGAVAAVQVQPVRQLGAVGDEEIGDEVVVDVDPGRPAGVAVAAGAHVADARLLVHLDQG